MKILFYFIGEVAPDAGGVERVMSIMYEELIKMGYEIDILYLISSTSSNVIPNQIQLPVNKGQDIKNKLYIEELLTEKHYNIALNFAAIFNKSSIAFVDACHNIGVPQIAIYHNTLDIQLWKNNITRKFLRYRVINKFLHYILGIIQRFPLTKNALYISKKSIASIVLANSYIPQYKQIINKHPNHLQSIYNPLPYIGNFDDGVTKDNIVLVVGRLESQKNLSLLLQIWSEINIPDWKLQIVGTGSKVDSLKDLTINLGIQDKVIFCGKSNNPAEYYQRAKIFAMTSIFEGYPMTLIESQNFGCVPILFDTFPAANEIVKNNYNGFVISQYDKEEYKNKLVQLMTNPSLLKNLMINTLKESGRYDLNKVIQEWDNLIKKFSRQYD